MKPGMKHGVKQFCESDLLSMYAAGVVQVRPMLATLTEAQAMAMRNGHGLAQTRIQSDIEQLKQQERQQRWQSQQQLRPMQQWL